MRKGLQGKRKGLFSNSLKGILLFVGIFVFGGSWSQDLHAQSEINVNFTTCAGSFVTGDQLMDAGGVPGGHRDGGTWVDTDGLDFSDLGRNPIITGFVLGGNYTIRWNRTPSKTYLFNINVPTQATDYSLLNESGNTSDVISAGATHNFEIDITTGSNVKFYEKLMPDGDPVLIQDGASSNLAYSVSATDVHQVYAVVTDPNGCVVMTNAIEISQGAIQIRVEGGQSVCDGSYNYDLYVRPYDPVNYDYRWLVNSTQSGVRDAETVTVTGPGTYTAEIYPNGASFVPGQLISAEDVDVGSYTLPEVTIDPSGYAALCDAATGIVLTGEMTPAHTENVSYEWTRNGSNHAEDDEGGGGPVSNAITVNNTGTYDFRVYETNNPLCYRDATEDVTVVTPMATFEAVNSGACSPAEPSFLVEIIGQVGDTWDVEISDGSNSVVENLVDGDSDGVASGTIAWGTDITSSTNYSVTVTSGSACTITDIPGDVLFEVVSAPLIFDVSGSGCAGDNIQIELSDSETGVNYELLLDGTVIDDQDGTTGSAITFDVTNAAEGIYEISGTRGSCSRVMNGAVNVSPAPSDQNISTASPACPGSDLVIDASESDVDYYLLRDGSRTGAVIGGSSTGGPITFGNLTTAGVYTVEAERNGCVITLSGSLEIQAYPSQYTLNANTTSYCIGASPTGIELTLSFSQSGIEYQLQRHDGTNYINYGSSASGTGTPFSPSWTNIPNGTYRVVATTTAGCPRIMSGTPTIVENDPPDANVTRSSPGTKCVGSSTEFWIYVDLIGAAPFSFEIERNGTVIETVANHASNYYELQVDPTGSGTYTYTLTNLTDATGCAPVTNVGDVDFSVYPRPNITFNSSNGISVDGSGNASTEMCFGSSVDLTANAYNTPGPYSYEWSTSNTVVGDQQTETFNPNTNRTYTVAVTDDNYGCSNTRDIEVIVNSLPVVGFTPADASEVCENGGVVNLDADAPNDAGTFSDLGGFVSGEEFDPAAAGMGWHNITYTYTSPTTGCSNDVTNSIYVNPPPTLSITGLAGDYCADAGTPTITGSPNNAAGSPEWSVVGLSPNPGWFIDNNDGTVTFDVADALSISGDGPYTFVYEYTNPTTGCSNQISGSTYFHDDVNDELDFYWSDDGGTSWNKFPDPSDPDLLLCQSDGPVQFEAFFNAPTNPLSTSNPVGAGDFSSSGDGLTNNSNGTGELDPDIAGNGTHTISFDFTDVNGCSGSVSYDVQIGTDLQFSSNLADIYCVTDNTTHTIHGEPQDGSLPDGGTLNLYRASLPLTGAETPVSSVGPVAGANPEIDFTPSTVGADTYVFEYIYDHNGCQNVITHEVLVPAALDASFGTSTGDTEFCISDGSVTFTPTQPGGSYSGDGVSGDSFNPSAAGAGVHDITYSINTGGCFSESTISLTVHAPAVGVALGGTDFCQNDQALYPVEATNLILSGGVYDADVGFESANYTFSAPSACFYRLDGSGNPDPATYQTSYTVSDGDAPVYFDPGEAPVGTFNITLDFDDTASGSCLITETYEVTITETPSVNFGTAEPLEFCQNSSPVIFTGRYAGAGATGSGYFMLDGDPLAAGIDNEIDGAGTDNNGRAEFDPSQVSATIAQQITYVYEQSGCASSRTKDFEIKPAPTVFNITPAAPDAGIYCFGSDVTIGLSSSQEGVSYDLLRDGSVVQTHDVNIGDPEVAFDFAPVEDEGTYRVRANLIGVPDACTSMMDGSVEVRENKVTAVVDYVINPACNGADDGEIHVSASSLSSAFSYTLDDGVNPTTSSSTGEFTGLEDGTYTISIVDDYGCSLAEALDPVTLNEPDPLTLTSGNVNDVTCHGGNDGSFRITVTGGTSSNYQYSLDGGASWINGNSQHTFTNLFDGTYNVQVRDAGNPSCIQSLAPAVVIDEPDGPVQIAFDNIVDVDCTSDGEIEVRGEQAGYSGVFNYVLYREVSPGNWVQVDDDNQPDGTNTIFPITGGGDYRVDVFGENNCSTSGYYTVIAPGSVPVVELAGSGITHESSTGAADGSIEIGVTGGEAPYTITWEEAGTVIPGENNTTLTGLSAGTYAVIVEDNNGCQDDLDPLVVEANPLFDIGVTTTEPYPCYGSDNGKIGLTVQGGMLPYASITLTNSAGDVVTPSSSGDTFANYSGLTGGNYTATAVDDNGASVSDNITLADPDELILSFTKNSDAECLGEDGEITFSATGGTVSPDYTFTIIPESGSSSTYPEVAATDVNVNNLSAGTYELQVRDDVGCYDNHFFEITEPEELSINVTDRQHVKCHGETTGKITVSVDGRPGGTSYNYTWEEFTGDPAVPGDFTDPANWIDLGVNSQTISGLSGDAYYRVMAETSTCESEYTGPIYLRQPDAALDVTTTPTNVETCHGESTGSISLSVTGGTAPYIINYGTVSDSWSGLTDYTVTGLSAGTYDFEIVDDNGCLFAVSENITEPDLFEVNVIDYGIACDNLTSGYVNFEVSGGLEVAGENLYHVRIVRHENKQVYYQGDEVNADPTTPLSLNSSVLIGGTDHLIEGIYTLKVYDANSTDPSNCMFEQEFTLENIAIDATETNPTCISQDNGSIDITVSGGSGNFNYAWSASAGGTVPAGQINDKNLSGLSPGTYELILTDIDEGNCTVTESYTIAYTNTLSVDVSATDVSCFNSSDGSVTATASGGVAPYDYIWEKDISGTWTTLMNSQTLDPVGIGDYRVNVIDANGCTIQSGTVTVDRPGDFSLTIDPTDISNVTCNSGNDGSFIVTPDDPAGNFEYSIDGGSTWQISADFDNLSAGVYAVSMRDLDTNAPYCTKLDIENVTITEPDPLAVDQLNKEDVECHGETTATGSLIEVNALGGTGPYTYQWYHVVGSVNDILVGETTERLEDRPAGDYRVRVYDDNSCNIWSDVYTISEPATAPEITIENEVHQTAPGATDGSITISIAGGVSPYGIVWEDGAGINIGTDVTTVSDLGEDDYTVTVTDANGCVVDQTIPLREPNSSLHLSINEQLPPGPCHGATNGVIELLATGGNSDDYTFTLVRQPSTTIPDPAISGGIARYEDLAPGFYNAQVEDANGVVESIPDIDLSEPDSVVLTITNESDVACFNESNGSVDFTIEGGSGDYLYTIFSEDQGTVGGGTYTAGDPDVSETGLSADDYEITVADNNSCSDADTFTITQPNELTIDQTDYKDVTCFDGNNGSLTVTINGRPVGTSFTYDWEVDADKNNTWVPYTATTGTLTNLEAGYYRVNATETLTGCPVPELTVEINEPPVVELIQVDKDNVTTCHGDSTGSVRFSVTGGTAPYSIKYGTVEESWDGTGDYTATGLTAGFYDFEVFDANGCSDDIPDVEITEPDPLQVTILDHGILCDQATSGWLDFDVTGGVDDAGFRYDVRLVRQENNQEYYNNVETASPVYITNLREGTYTLEVFDANSTAADGCLFTYEFTLENITIDATVVHPTCDGQNNGSIDITVNGGTGTYHYAWSDAGGTFNSNDEDISNLAPETYTLVLTDYDGQPNACSITEPFELNYQNTLSVDASATDVSCFNSSDGSVTATASGGVAPYDYIWEKETPAGSGTWTTLMNSQTLDPVGIGDYRVNVIDANGCTIQSGTVTVDRPGDFSLTVDPANIFNVTCNGGNDGSFIVTPDDPAGNFEYSIDGGSTWQISPDFDNLSAGVYAVSMRDLDTNAPYCTKLDIENVTITEPDPLAVDLLNIEDVECHGETTATGSLIEVNALGGTPDMSSGSPVYTYQWYHVVGSVNDILVGETTERLEDRPAGDYRVRVYDDNSCNIWSDIYTISEPATAPEITIEDEVHPTAPGATDGSITISIAGGVSPYGVAWEDGAGINIGTDVTTVSDLGEDDYTVTVTDANGCVVDQTRTLSEPGAALNLILEEQVPPGPCHGAANGVIELRATGGNSDKYTFTLVRQPLTTIPDPAISGNIARYENLESGIYIARVEDDNGVVFEITDIDLTEPDPLALTITDIRDASCNGDADGFISFDISGGDISSGDYVYTIIPENGSAITGSTSASASENILWADNYELFVTDGTGACTVSESFTVGEPDPISITGTTTDITCNGASNGEISIDVTGGRGEYTAYTYEWYEIGDPVNPIATINDGSTTIDGLPAGTYYVEASELASTGCSQTSGNFEVEEPDALTVFATTEDVTTCTGDNSGSIEVNVTGGTPPYIIDYGVGTVNGGGPIFTIDGLTANTYTITVQDDNGCEEVVSNLVINEPAAPLSISSVDADIACLEPGNETSGTVDFDISGGVDDGSGNYSYHVRLLNTNTSVIQTQVISGTNNQPENISFTGLVAGDYEIRVTDTQAADASSGCVNPVTDDFTLEHIGISGDAVNATCSGQYDGEIINVEVAGASSNYTFNWTTADGFGIDNSSLDQSGLAPGTYNLEITDPDRGGCTIDQDFIVENDHTLNITASVKDVSCAGGGDGAIRNVQVTGISSNPSQAVQYVWQGPGIGTITQNDQQFDFVPNLYDLEPGSYTLTVTDGNSCNVTKVFTVAEPNPIEFTLSSTLDVCDPYTRTIQIDDLDNTDGTGDPANFNYPWNGEGNYTIAADEQSITDVSEAGTYSVRVVDEAGCSHEESIDVFGEISVDDDRTHVKCNGGNDGSIVLTITGGSGNYTYAWEDASGNPTADPTVKNQNGLTAGTYTITITDTDAAQVCGGTPYEVTKEFPITQPSEIVIDYEKTDVSCNGNADGQITLDVTGGSGSYEYAWTPASALGIVQGRRIQTGLEGGIYGVEVTDASTNCQQNETIEIIEPAALDFDVTFTDTQCDGTNSITLDEASATGGFGPYEFSATGPGVPSGWTETDDFTDVEGGEYNFTLTDLGSPGNCSVTKTVILAKDISITPVVTDETCPDSNNGAIELEVEGGRSPFTFSWTDENDDPTVSPNNKNQSGLSGGTYTVEYEDDRGCIDSMDVTVPITNNIELKPSITPIICYGDSTGAISLNPEGGSGHFSFVWNGPEDFSSDQEDITNLIGGTYYVEVIDDSLEHHSITCRFEESIVVSQPSAPIAVTNVDITDVLCNGNNTGSVEVTVEGGMEDGNYNYKWSGPGDLSGQTTNQLIDVGAGNYYLNVTDGVTNCVANFGPYTINEPAQELDIVLDERLDVTVPGGSNGAIQVNVTGGNGSYSFAWTETTGSFTGTFDNSNRNEGLTAGSYDIIVTDDNGCTDDITVILSEPGDALSILSSHEDVRPCNGNNNGELSVQAFGGTPFMSSGSAAWDIVVTRGGVEIENVKDDYIILKDLLPGSYYIEVTDSTDVTVDEYVTISEPPAVDISIDDVTPVTCVGGNDGSIEVTVSGGIPRGGAGGDYQLELSGASATSGKINTTGNYTFSNLIAGDYTLRVWDDYNDDGSFTRGTADEDCFQTVSLTVSEPDVIASLEVVSGSETLCDGQRPQLSLTIGNWDFSTNNLDITLNDGTVVTVDQSPFIFQTDDAPSPGVMNYEVTSVVETGGTCEKGVGDGVATVTVNERPTAAIFGDGRSCPGDTRNISVSLTGDAPWSIVYTDDTNNYTVDNIMSSTEVIAVSPVETKTYSLVSVSDATGCSGSVSGSATITVDSPTTVEMIPPVDPEICRGDNSYIDFDFDPDTNGPWIVTYETDDGTDIDEHTITVEDSDLEPGETYYRMDVAPLVTTGYSLMSVTDTHGGDNSCDADVTGNSFDITVKEVPDVAGNIAGDTPVCQLDTVTYSVAPIADAISYSWDMPAGFHIINGNGTTSVDVTFSDSAESGYIIVSGQNNCGTGPIRKLWVEVNQLPQSIGAIDGPTDICEGSQGIGYSVPTVADASGYHWTVPPEFTIVSGQGTANIVVDLDPYVNSTTGIFTVTPQNACGLSTHTSDTTVNVLPLPVANAGGDQQLCDNTGVLDADPPGTGFTGNWDVVSGYADFDDPGSPSSVVNNIPSGVNVRLEWTVTDDATGCSVSDTVTVRNNELSVDADAGKTLTCDGSTDLFGKPLPPYPNTTGRWEIMSGAGNITDGQSSEASVTNLAPGVNTLRWTITQNGCESFGEVDIVNDQTDPAVIDSESLVDLCGTTAGLSAIPVTEGAGEWSIEQGSATIMPGLTDTDISVSNLPKGETILRWTVTKNSCNDHDEVTLRNNQLEVDAGDNFTTCEDTYQLDGTERPPGVDGEWGATGAADGEVNFVNGSTHDTEISGLVNGPNKLYWTLIQNGCASTDTVIITSNKATTAQVGVVQDICNEKDSTVLTGNNITGALEEGRWSVEKGSGSFEDRYDPRTTVTNVGFGENIYRWTIYNGTCTSSADLKVINNQADAYAGKDTVTCNRYVNQLNADPVPEGFTGHWTIEEGGGIFDDYDDAINDPSVGVNLAPGQNTLRWNVTHDGTGCSTFDDVVIQVDAIGSFDAGSDKEVTDGSGSAFMNATLPSGTGISGQWSIISGGGEIQTIDDPLSRVDNLQRGPSVFRWTVSNGTCVDYDEVLIENGEVREAETGPPIFTCSPEATLTGNDPDNAIGRWTVVSGSGKFEDDMNPRTRVYDLGNDENVFRWTISYGQGFSSSEDTIVVTNNQPDDAKAGLDESVCNDEYTLSGNDPDTGMGDVSWKLISGSGTIDTPDQNSSLVTGLSQGENRFVYTIEKGDAPNNCYSSDTVVITNGLATPADAGEDRTICTDSVKLEPNVPNHGTGEWLPFEGSAEFHDNWAKNIARGTNKFLWVVSTENCTSVDTVVIINNKPSEANAGRDRAVCTSNVTLSGSLPQYHDGKWTLISGSGTILETDSANSVVTGLGSGSNRFRWTITNGECFDSDEVEIRNDFIKAEIRYDAAAPLCVDTALISANNPSPGTGTWGVVGGAGAASFDDPDNPETVVSNLQQGENILTWRVTNGECPDVDSVTIINNMPTPAVAGQNEPTCDNHVYLAGNNPVVGTGKWDIRQGSGIFSDDMEHNTRVDSLSFGANVFRWTVSNKGCHSFDDVQIDFNSIEAKAGGSRTICSDTETLNANNPSPGTGTWTVAGGSSQAIFDDISDPKSTVRNLRKGANTLRWTIKYKGCPTYEEVTITNALPSTANAGANEELCDDNTTLDATDPDIGVGRWTIISGSADLDASEINNHEAPVTGLAKGETVLRWIVENDICSSEDDVRVVNNQPSTPDAGADHEVCESNYELNAATPDYGDGLWSIVEGGGNFSNVTDPETEIRNLQQGRNVLKWTLYKGQCSLSDEIVIENNTATTANAGPDVSDCKDWAKLDGNPGIQGNGEWSIVSGLGSFDNPSDEATVISDLGFGKNILMWKITNGDKCYSLDTVVIFNKVPEQADAGNPRELCENYTTLNGNSPPDEATGTWSVVSGAGQFDSPNSPNSIVRDIGFGENIYKWTISYEDCDTESTVAVRSNKTDAYAGEDVVVYDPEVILNANNVGGLNARWNLIGGAGVFDDPTFFNTRVDELNEGVNTYRWVIEVDGCLSQDDVSVEYRPVPDAGFITDTAEGCWPVTVNFTNYSVGVQDRDYHWEFGDGNSSGDQNPVHTFETEGEYPVILTVPGPDGIEGRYQKIIRVYDHPEAAFSVMPEEVYVPGDEVRFFDLSVDAVNYEWHFGDGNISTEPHPVHEYQESGLYDVMLHVTNEYGCVDSTVIEGAVTAISKGFIKFPNAFRPRPDAGSSSRASDTNNIFKPVYRDVDTYQLQIYNRWGQLIYESNDIDEGWNGLYKGQLAPQAVYVWKVNGTFLNGREFRETGSVLLVR